ncbi:dual specificity tyrosine-phosphorylation-regulated kinase 4-like [Hoplias malabaricus]|uniref:dual specificity tyrosine-phosphorylation-regulated kinase 4-like n=1 Tax=Hoplias malabaricus TaxID=27720 RepID=UPI003462643C
MEVRHLCSAARQREMKKRKGIQAGINFPEKGGKPVALPQLNKQHSGNPQLVPSQPRKLTGKPEVLPQLTKQHSGNVPLRPSPPRELTGKPEVLPQLTRQHSGNVPLRPSQPRKLAGMPDVLPQLNELQCGNVPLRPSQPRELGGKPCALPQINKQQSGNTVGHIQPRKMGGKPEVLPQLTKQHSGNIPLRPSQPRELTGKPEVLPQLTKHHSGNSSLRSSQPRKLAGMFDVLPQLNELQCGNVPLRPSQPRELGGKPDVLPPINKQQSGNVPLGLILRRKLESMPRTSVFKPLLQNLPECGATNNTSQSPSQKPRRQPEDFAFPMAPADVMTHFGNGLTNYEQDEVWKYKEIWFLGLNAKKINGSLCNPNQSGYDDKNGTYVQVRHDHIAYRYEVLDMIGKGSFGQVLKCLDHKTNKMVAIKVIRNKSRCRLLGMLELKILDALRKKDIDDSSNIIHMEDSFFFRGHLCITFELLGPNLYEQMELNGYQGFNQDLVRNIAQMLLKTLNMLKKEKIIYCDLKPENILLSQNGKVIKVIDFGSSFYEDQRVHRNIGTWFYRPPEVILGQPCSCAMDMWSLGCILAELSTSLPLFAEVNEVEQIACMMEVLGLPPPEVLQTASRREQFFDSEGKPHKINNSTGQIRKPSSKNLESVLKCNDARFLDFIKGCLMWDPMKRFTPEEAMQHAWIQGGTTTADQIFGQ